jgi:hypothetical protein
MNWIQSRVALPSKNPLPKLVSIVILFPPSARHGLLVVVTRLYVNRPDISDGRFRRNDVSIIHRVQYYRVFFLNAYVRVGGLQCFQS